MKSLLFQGVTPFTQPPACANLPPRVEARLTFKKGGRLYHFTVRDKVMPEDAYLMLIKASAFAIKMSEPYNGRTPARAIKDFLIKSSVVI